MNPAFLLLPLAAAALDWTATARRWERLPPLTKPAPIALLIIWLGGGLLSGSQPIPLGLLTLGLIGSLIGDLLFLSTRDRFIPALAAFLAAQVCYTAAFNLEPLPLNFSTGLLLFAVLAVFIRVYRRVAAGLAQKTRLPVLLYGIALGGTLFSALATLAKNSWSAPHALAAAAGALLFFLSDLVLVWHRFVAPLPRRDLKVRIAYHLGQILLLAGAALHFLPPA